MINFYNYFNFFFLNKKKFFNLVKCISIKKKLSKKLLIFFVDINATKIDIKKSIEFLFKIKILKINTLIIKKNKTKKKKAFIIFNDFI